MTTTITDVLIQHAKLLHGSHPGFFLSPSIASRASPVTLTQPHIPPSLHVVASHGWPRADRDGPPVGKDSAHLKGSNIAPYDGAPGGVFVQAVEALSGSLTRHNATVIELGSEETALIWWAFKSARLYFKTRAQNNGSGRGSWGKSSRGVYMY